MFSLDHTHYARWMSIFIHDMKMLPEKHSAVYDEFRKCHFTVKKTARVFSCIAEDQAHKQNNKTLKIDGGAIGILENELSLIKWMVAGPGIARLVSMFNNDARQSEDVLPHHEDTDSHEKRFRKDVLALKNALADVGSPFEEDDILIQVILCHCNGEC